MNVATILQKSKRPELVVIAMLAVVSLGAWAVWLQRWNARAARRDEMNVLYSNASGGDRASVRRLAEYPSPDAMRLIEKLARNRTVFSDGRLEAIDVLGARHPIDSKTLAPLLWIDEPFAIRRAVAGVFKQHGCDDECISATLPALHAIWAGQPTLEMQLTAQIANSRSYEQEDMVYFHKQTEEDYFVLLNSNPCGTGKTLQTKYGSDAQFVEQVRKKLRPC